MQLVDIHIKLELRLDDRDDPKKLALEICRQLKKSYGVRAAEVSNIVHQD